MYISYPLGHVSYSFTHFTLYSVFSIPPTKGRHSFQSCSHLISQEPSEQLPVLSFSNIIFPEHLVYPNLLVFFFCFCSLHSISFTVITCPSMSLNNSISQGSVQAAFCSPTRQILDSLIYLNHTVAMASSQWLQLQLLSLFLKERYIQCLHNTPLGCFTSNLQFSMSKTIYFLFPFKAIAPQAFPVSVTTVIITPLIQGQYLNLSLTLASPCIFSQSKGHIHKSVHFSLSLMLSLKSSSPHLLPAFLNNFLHPFLFLSNPFFRLQLP